jgi:hypothetical protein
MRAVAFATVIALFLAGPALADEPIATAPATAPAAPQPATSSPPLLLPGVSSVEGQPLAMGPCGPEKVKPDGSLGAAPHGELEAGVGTNGYHHVGGTVCQPIGQGGAVALSIGETQLGGSNRRH